MITDNHNIFSEIVLNNVFRERKTFSKNACYSNKGKRKKPESPPDRKNIRPIFAHDADRIIHSLSYSRYIDKTQAFYLFENDHITHRVLHVQLVSKIGRVVGRCLKLNEDLIEAIALGHDLGHSPYGHDGEKILNNICKCKKNNIGLFKHNAQSVRFLMEIENDGKGLNLSLQVLDGILAHNGETIAEKYFPAYDKTWDEFEEDYNKCFSDEDYSKQIYPMTLEGCVVRISDIISYIGRDIEDAIELKLIERENIPKHIIKYLGETNKEIINTLVMDLIQNSYEKKYLTFNSSIYKALNDLLEFNYREIYNNQLLTPQVSKINDIICKLFDVYLSDLLNNRKESPIYIYFLNKMSQNYISKTSQKRQIIDFISGMTDDFLNNQYISLVLPQRYGYSINDPINIHL